MNNNFEIQKSINNYQAMREMISHLHKCHGCRSYWFVMGSEENYENRERIRALRDYMKEQKKLIQGASLF